MRHQFNGAVSPRYKQLFAYLTGAASEAELDALKPDLQKIRAFAESIRALALTAPKTKTKKAVGLVAGAITGLGAVAVALDAEADRWK